MMQDRTIDIASFAPKYDVDIEMQEAQKDEEEGDTDLTDLQSLVEEMKVGMSNIRANMKKMSDIYERSLISITNRDAPGELEKVIDSTNFAAAEIQNKLKSMNEVDKRFPNGSTKFRIRSNLQQSMARQFLTLMKEYQELQVKYKTKYRERVEREYKITKPSATKEEIDLALESGKTDIFQQQLLDVQSHQKAKESLIYIQSRHKDIMRLEQSIKELHVLFLDLGLLVTEQGELMDQIEFNVSQAVTDSKISVLELHEANVLQKKSRKKMCCLAIILLVIFLIIGGALVGVFSNFLK